MPDLQFYHHKIYIWNKDGRIMETSINAKYKVPFWDRIFDSSYKSINVEIMKLQHPRACGVRIENIAVYEMEKDTDQENWCPFYMTIPNFSDCEVDVLDLSGKVEQEMYPELKKYFGKKVILASETNDSRIFTDMPNKYIRKIESVENF
jgi:hypothetical protein